MQASFVAPQKRFTEGEQNIFSEWSFLSSHDDRYLKWLKFSEYFLLI